MIDASNDQVTFSFPEVHPDARLVVEFQRTLRIPDGERDIPRLPSLGRYPVYTIDEHAQRVPRHWIDTGGAMLPMYQSEAMWLSFRPTYSLAHQAFYPFAVKILSHDEIPQSWMRRGIDFCQPRPNEYSVFVDEGHEVCQRTYSRQIQVFLVITRKRWFGTNDICAEKMRENIEFGEFLRRVSLQLRCSVYSYECVIAKRREYLPDLRSDIRSDQFTPRVSVCATVSKSHQRVLRART